MDKKYQNKIIDIAEKYFTDEDLLSVFKELELWNISNDIFFCQVSQEEDKPKLEIAFISNQGLLDYTLVSSKKEFIICKFEAIDRVELNDSERNTDLYIGEQNLAYHAHIDENRENLRQFAKSLLKLISLG